MAEDQAVLAAREALAAAPGADVATKVDVGRSLTAVVYMLSTTGRTDDALASYRRSEPLLVGLVASNPAAGAALAACHAQTALLLRHAGKFAEAIAASRLARADQEVLAAERSNKFVEIVEQHVGQDRALNVAPKAFDQVEAR